MSGSCVTLPWVECRQAIGQLENRLRGLGRESVQARLFLRLAKSRHAVRDRTVGRDEVVHEFTGRHGCTRHGGAGDRRTGQRVVPVYWPIGCKPHLNRGFTRGSTRCRECKWPRQSSHRRAVTDAHLLQDQDELLVVGFRYPGRAGVLARHFPGRKRGVCDFAKWRAGTPALPGPPRSRLPMNSSGRSAGANNSSQRRW